MPQSGTPVVPGRRKVSDPATQVFGLATKLRLIDVVGLIFRKIFPPDAISMSRCMCSTAYPPQQMESIRVGLRIEIPFRITPFVPANRRLHYRVPTGSTSTNTSRSPLRERSIRKVRSAQNLTTAGSTVAEAGPALTNSSVPPGEPAIIPDCETYGSDFGRLCRWYL